MLGHFTQQATSRGRSHSYSQHGHSSVSRNESDQRRALLLPQEFKELGSERLVVIAENCKPILGEKIRYHQEAVFKARLQAPPRIPPMNMALHVARVQQRWREEPEDLPPGQSIDVAAMLPDWQSLPDPKTLTPEAAADLLLDVFREPAAPTAATEATDPAGGTVEPAVDEDGVIQVAAGLDVERLDSPATPA